MVDENLRPREEKNPDEGPKILTKPLPEILEEMENNIKAAAEASRKAEQAAKEAKVAEESATSAAEEAATYHIRPGAIGYCGRCRSYRDCLVY